MLRNKLTDSVLKTELEDALSTCQQKIIAYSFNEGEGRGNFYDTMSFCIRKQIPMKPKFEKMGYQEEVYICPVCGGKLGYRSFAIEQGEYWCSRCGQSLDWWNID